MYKINKTKIHLSFYFSLNMKLKPGQDMLRGVVGGCVVVMIFQSDPARTPVVI